MPLMEPIRAATTMNSEIMFELRRECEIDRVGTGVLGFRS